MQSHCPSSPKTLRVLAFGIFHSLTLATLSLLASGCGQTGAPLAPSLELATPVTDLAASREADRVSLRWTMPRRSTDKLLLKGPQSAHICRKVEDGPCIGVADLTFAPDKPAKYEDALPADLASGPPRLLAYVIEVRNRHGHAAGNSNFADTVAGAAPSALTGVHGEVRADGVALQWQPSEIPAELSQDQHKIEIHRTLLSVPGDAKPADDAKSPLGGTKPPLIREQTLTVRLPPGADPGRALDPDAVFDQRYRYRITRVSVVTVAGKPIEIAGPVSAEIMVDTRDTFPPQPPSGLAAVSAPEEGAIDLSWSPNSEADLAGYAVYRSVAGSQPQRLSTTPIATSDFRDRTAQPGQQYTYSVTAIDRDGNESARSVETSESLPPRQ